MSDANKEWDTGWDYGPIKIRVPKASPFRAGGLNGFGMTGGGDGNRKTDRASCSREPGDVAVEEG